MNNRPLPVTIIGWLYIVVGAVGFASQVTEFKTLHPFPFETTLVEAVRLTAVVSGIYMLRGKNWARWLAVAWIGFHVILSAFHTILQLGIHIVFCAILVYFLFRPTATRYFRRG